MLVNAAILAGLSATGLVFVFKKLPPKVQEYLLRHPLQTEILTFLATYATLGGSLTALFAGAIVGTVTTALLHVREHRDEYQGLILGAEWLIQKCKSLLNQANSYLVNTLKSTKEPARIAA